MTRTDRDRWDSRYAAAAGPASPPAATLGWLPSAVVGHDHALDLACGTGRNTRALLAAGYRVVAADISRVALATLRASIAPPASALLVQLDVDAWPFAEASFDLVVQIDFLDRDALAAARRSVKPGGLLLLDTFAGPPRPGRPGPQRGAWRLDHGELATRFADWEVVRVDDEPTCERAAILARRPLVGQPLR